MLRILAPQGFVFVHNLGLRGPEFVHSEYPVEWQREYESRNYMWADPILLWSMLNRGDRRWSEINSIDLRGVMSAARRYRLNHGAIFCRGAVKKSVLSLARADREFTDEEMALLSSMVGKLVEDASLDMAINEAEAETLRRFRDGLSYKEIGLALKLSPSTVKLRLANARKKLGAVSNVHALAVALNRNLL
jgi:LuxR family transcriptional regulator